LAKVKGKMDEEVSIRYSIKEGIGHLNENSFNGGVEVEKSF
jgi:hypothetical protein